MIYEKEKRYIIPFDDVPAARAKMPDISVDERRGNYEECETGFPEEMAIKEAKRCLSCRRCLGCALCWAECEPEAIDFQLTDEVVEETFDEVVITQGQNNAFNKPAQGLAYGKYPDVISDLQFERMLSEHGPTDGLVLSPATGEVPERIAIVQGAVRPSDDQLTSSFILGVNEAVIALAKTEGLEVVLVTPLSEAAKEQFLPEASGIANLKIVDGTPSAVTKPEEGGPLKLELADNGETREEPFNLVVVLTEPKVSDDAKALSRKLDQEIV